MITQEDFRNAQPGDVMVDDSEDEWLVVENLGMRDICDEKIPVLRIQDTRTGEVDIFFWREGKIVYFSEAAELTNKKAFIRKTDPVIKKDK